MCKVPSYRRRYHFLDQSFVVGIETRSGPPWNEHTVQCFATNNARHSHCVSTADGVSQAAIRTG